MSTPDRKKRVGFFFFVYNFSPSLSVYKAHLPFHLISILITTMGGGPASGFVPDGFLSTYRPDSLVCGQTSSDVLSSKESSLLAQHPTDVLKKKKKKKKE